MKSSAAKLLAAGRQTSEGLPLARIAKGSVTNQLSAGKMCPIRHYLVAGLYLPYEQGEEATRELIVPK
jgi:hypothetical protein